MQARQTCFERCDPAQDDYGISEPFGDVVERGQTVFAQLFRTLHQADLPPGAVIEIECTIRRRAVVIPT